MIRAKVSCSNGKDYVDLFNFEDFSRVSVEYPTDRIMHIYLQYPDGKVKNVVGENLIFYSKEI
jgi:hypothetical protein